jgi:L-alanine-DL-glutamate epimerase-like enolase superfamily enzyme
VVWPAGRRGWWPKASWATSQRCGGASPWRPVADLADADLAAQCRDGLARGFHVFYLKVGIDVEEELEVVRCVREAVGPRCKIRLDANGAWQVNEAVRNLARLDEYPSVEWSLTPAPAGP